MKDFPGTITVCDSTDIIIDLNNKAVENLREQGDEKLVGTNLVDWHPEPARTKLKELMEKRRINIYTMEKNGVRELVHQAPW